MPGARTRAWLIATVTGVAAALAYGSFLTRLTADSRVGRSASIAAVVALGALFSLSVLAFVLALRRLSSQDRAGWRNGLPILRGERVWLRELDRRDSAALLDLLTPDTLAYLPPAPRTIRAARRFITSARVSRARGRGCCFAIAAAGNSRLIGLVQFFALPGPGRVLGWGFLLDATLWGRGLFDEAAALALPFAFDVMHAGTIDAWVAEHNGRANRALARLGASAVSMKAARVPDGRTGDFVWWTLRRPARVE